jgi:N utilization substance protein A
MSVITLPGLQDMIDNISRERNLPKHAVQEALREALLKGYERFRRTTRPDDQSFDEEYFDNFEVELDIEEEGFRVLAAKAIVEGVASPDHEIALTEVREVAPEAQLGDTVVLDITPDQAEFGRMAAIQTKQVLAQKLRDQQRKLVQEEFQELEGTVLQGRVLRFERQSVIMAVNSGYGNPEVEAELLKRDQLPNDNYRANMTFRVFLKRVSEGAHRGPQLLVSRADAGLVVDLFATEVPEIEEEIVRIVAVAREANPPSRSVGPRTKIAVDTLERDVDPVGACIGARGSRIQAVVNELRGEKIDVIRWSPDPSTYIANALSPAKVTQVILMNPEDMQAHVLVPEDQLSLAIGKEGQNVRLAARLTGWKIDIKDAAKYDFEVESQKMAELIEQRRQERAVREAAEAAAREAREAAAQEAEERAAKVAALEAAAAEEYPDEEEAEPPMTEAERRIAVKKAALAAAAAEEYGIDEDKPVVMDKAAKKAALAAAAAEEYGIDEEDEEEAASSEADTVEDTPADVSTTDDVAPEVEEEEDA